MKKETRQKIVDGIIYIIQYRYLAMVAQYAPALAHALSLAVSTLVAYGVDYMMGIGPWAAGFLVAVIELYQKQALHERKTQGDTHSES